MPPGKFAYGMDLSSLTIVGTTLSFIHLLGILTSVHAVMNGRTPQGAIAWALTLVFIPYFSLPIYWVFGRSKFQGYINSRRVGNERVREHTKQLRPVDPRFLSDLNQNLRYKVLEELADYPFTTGNGVELLIDGDATYDAIEEAIRSAREYILFQFYIIRDDESGRRFRELLIEKAQEGVRVYFLYDEIGSYQLPHKYLEPMRHAGVSVSSFHTTKGRGNRFQLNFRNHRKIVVADGRVALVGGLNIGNEYQGKSERFGPWRDTHIRLSGPAVQSAQWSFVEDWYWANHMTPDLQWQEEEVENGTQQVLILHSGPVDDLETCGLFFAHLCNVACKRVWIASPYFVPDRQLIAALQLAALRGCDVRIMLPERPDHLMVYLSSFAYMHETATENIRFYRYQPGFLHQKVILIDDELAAIGTANLDNRSVRLNFEIMASIVDPEFAKQVETMLERDFDQCVEVDPHELPTRSFMFRLIVSLSRLLAPIQ